ncbi:MAG: DUF2232 domain-containing protein [Candidatus Competibacteraceae bacterium]|nr:DUF2232 domain-containing protein [Candidatus Competibacteraceae bacterium]
MRSLAAFVMRGRSGAALVAATAAVLFWLFPPFLIVATAVVTLVTLRRGALEGALVALAAGAAATALTWGAFGRPWPMLQLLLPCWSAAWLLALTLRATVSLSRAFQAAALLGFVGVAGIYLVFPDPTAWWRGVLARLRQEFADPAAAGLAPDRAGWEQLLELIEGWAPYLPGHMVSAALMVALLALLLGRWWQATLYNPGGFRPEFQELRLGRTLAALTLVLFAAMLLIRWPPLVNLALVLGALYTLQGVALVHAAAFKLQLSPAWLLLFYLLLVPLLSQLVMALGVADAWADFRNRIRPRTRKP